MPSTRPASAARQVMSPVRGYFNEHFEAVKVEVRDRSRDQTAELIDAISAAVHDAVRAESAQVLAALTDLVDDQSRRVEALETMITELRATNDQLLAVVAELVMRPDGATTEPTEIG